MNFDAHSAEDDERPEIVIGQYVKAEIGPKAAPISVRGLWARHPDHNVYCLYFVDTDETMHFVSSTKVINFEPVGQSDLIDNLLDLAGRLGKTRMYLINNILDDLHLPADHPIRKVFKL
ncbi:MAG TPA: hypothetical protein VHK27_04065 [Gammaproteobacteria bacterium]|nr:hypothetical protein [Gammaproteobacteria bacterium]